MKWKLRIVIVTLLSIFILAGSVMATADRSDEIIFMDKNLKSALSKYYDWNGIFTKEKAIELSKNKDYLILDSENISALDGLQYFENLEQVNLSGNTLSDLSVLPKLDLIQIAINYNSIKGKQFENTLNKMGKNEILFNVSFRNNEISDIHFLSKIGNIDSYSMIDMEENQIRDISVLKKATDLYHLDLSDNRITDVTPLEDLKNLTYYLDLRDNCIIDYKPIKPLLDDMFDDEGNETGLERYDYYTNPVNFIYNGETIEFPYLTAYYKYQAYTEAIPLFKALGGSAKYNKKTGTLTCKYDGNVLVMKDFSKNVTLNGKKVTLDYPMRRMQYDLAYVPVKDICEVLDLNYDVVKTRKIWHDYKYKEYAPKAVEISKAQKELG
jgi:hypothetical protein